MTPVVKPNETIAMGDNRWGEYFLQGLPAHLLSLSLSLYTLIWEDKGEIFWYLRGRRRRVGLRKFDNLAYLWELVLSMLGTRLYVIPIDYMECGASQSVFLHEEMKSSHFP